MNTAFIASLAFASLALALGAHAFAQDGAARPKPPVSVVPAPRSDQWAIERQNELLRRARESAPARVVFVGDSITQSWEGPGKAAWEKHIAPLGALNLGNSGDRTEHVLWRLSEAPLTRLAPKHVVLLIGTNNLGHGTSNAEETLQGVQSVADMLAEQCPDATIHILEIFPRGERFNAMRGDICQINQALRAFAARENAESAASGKPARFSVHAIGDSFVMPDGAIAKETMPDFLHLSPAAYEAWAVAVAKAVKQDEAAAGR
ncbi:MAG: GDSL-type esterase/lipase family protein [Planctomycetota bacterium]